jgi:hypothetical protein
LTIVHIASGNIKYCCKKALQINLFNITYDYVNNLANKIVDNVIVTIDFCGVLELSCYIS